MLIKSKTITADLMILLSALLWGGEYVVVKGVLEYLPPNWINAFRFIAASPLMFLLFRKSIMKLNRAEIKAGAILGIFLFGGFTLQTIGIQYTTAGKSGFLTSTYVVMIPFLVWIMRKKFPGIKSLISAVICLAGISLLSLESGISLNRGDMLTLASALCFSGSIIGFDYYSKIYAPLNLTFVEMLSGGLMSLVLALFTEPFPLNVSYGTSEIVQLFYLVVLGSLLCHVLSNVAMKWSESSHASILWSLESVFALFFGILFLNESVNGRMIGGFILVLAAVLITETGDPTIISLKRFLKKFN
jgi:drug/metabolite transporter (DMT)-like permease